MTARVPLPIAALALRARNAKSPKERHDLAYFAWEATVRLGVAARPPADRNQLGMPSTGHWVSALANDDRIFTDAPLLAVQALFAREGLDRESAPKSTKLARVLEGMAGYRNKVIGHGAVRSSEFYEEAGDTLLAGVEQLWAVAAVWPGTARLVYVESVEIGADGSRRGRLLELSGAAGRIVDPRGTAVLDDVQPHRLYLDDAGAYTSLHPWLLYQSTALCERVLFFNGRARTSKFLDYVGGEQIKSQELAELLPQLEADLDAAIIARSAEDEPAKDPAQFGDYRLLGKLGEGGMGIVHLARQENLGRLVAVKMLPAGAGDDPVVVARFKREIAALARCEHPNVIKILASGCIDGRHYYTMELVEGADLAAIAAVKSTGDDFDSAVSTASERVRTARADAYAHLPALAKARTPALAATPRSRVRAFAMLFRDAARGIAHLHEQGILHRDLKPGNLMVTEADHRVVVMDLGLAAMGDAGQTLTRDKSALLGTLRYMPPEQLQRNLLQLDRRADVYALGATFYELLCGRPVFDGDSDARLVEQVLRESPVPPRIANPALPRDLATILAKAIEKDVRMRYDSATALADDLDAYLEGSPIAARPPTATYLLGLAVRKHRALAATVLAAIVLGVAGAALFFAREHELRQQAQKNLAELLVEQGRATLLSGRPMVAAVYLSQAYSMGIEDVRLRALLADAMRPVDACTFRQSKAITRAAWSPDGKRIATASDDHTAVLWDVDRCARLPLAVTHGDTVESVAWSPDGSRIATASADGTAKVMNTSSGDVMTLAGHAAMVHTAAFSPDGARIVTASADQTAKLWDAQTGKLLATLSGHTGEVYMAAFSPDGKSIVTASFDKTARLWDASNGAPLQVLTGHDDVLWFAGFSRDGSRVATGSRDHSARVWDTATGKQLAICAGHTETVYAAVFSPDGTHLATAGWDHQARVWDITGDGCRLSTTLEGHDESVMSIAFTPDGQRVVTTSDDRTAKLWDAATGVALASFEGHDGWVVSGQVSADGKRLVTASLDGTARVWDLRPTRLAQTAHVTAPVVDTDGARALGISGHDATIWDAATGRLLSTLDHGTDIACARLADGERAVTAGKDGSVRVWQGASPRELRLDARAIDDVALSHDGKLLVTAGADGSASVWNALTGERIASLTGHRGPVRVAAFSSDDARVITAGDDRTARVWNAHTGALLATLDGHAYSLRAASFSPDGTRAVTTSLDHTARLWNLRDVNHPQLIAVLTGHRGWVMTARFDGSGERLITGSSDHSAKVWSAHNGKLLSSLESSAKIVAAAIANDGLHAVTANENHELEQWDIHLESRSPAEIARLITKRVPLRFVGGQVLPK